MSYHQRVPSPYGLLEDMRYSLKIDDGKVTWGEANVSTPQMHAKPAGEEDEDMEVEIAAYLLFEQTDNFTPEVFYDSHSDSLVSGEKDNQTCVMNELNKREVERDLDIDSFLDATALRTLVGDPDYHDEQYALDADGVVYGFDFGLAGNRVEEVSFSMLKFTSYLIESYDLRRDVYGLRNEVTDEHKIKDPDVREVLKDEVEERMVSAAEQIDIEKFRRDVEDHPNLDIEIGQDAKVDNIIQNINKMRDPEFALFET